ncbi:MAG: hypothetical protein ACE5D2_06035 [Fidelibacterota bacterium]
MIRLLKETLLRNFLGVSLLVVMMSCSKTAAVKETFPIGAVDFSFLQASNKIYVAASLRSSYKGRGLDSVMVLWQGLDSTATADTLRMNDDGTDGDIIAGDLIFARKFSNSSSNLVNVLPSTAKDSVYFSILVRYGNNTETLAAAYLLGNIRPRILSAWVPDTVIRPTSNADPNVVNTISFPVTCNVYDANGLEDIRRVHFRSYHTQLDSFMNNGDPIPLYDDGGGASGSGDLQKGDGTYTMTVSLTESATLGTFQWIFEAQDFSNAYSDTVIKVIVVQQ